MNTDRRCVECNCFLFAYPYKHNGVEKVEYRCPHPHGMTNRRDHGNMEPIDFGELDEERFVLGGRQ